MNNHSLNTALAALVDKYTIELVCDELTAICLDRSDKLNRGEAPLDNQTSKYWVKLARRFQGQR